MNKIIHFLILTFFGLVASAQSADFVYESSDGLYCTPSTIKFSQISTGKPVGFVWNFGNGTISNGPTPTTSFSRAGSYNVQLIVIYARTTITVNRTVVIFPAITASLGLNRNYICTPGDINFTVSGSSTISNYEWDFGDGNGIENSQQNTISHTFSDFGSFTVSMKATDDNGCAVKKTSVVSVKAPAITGTLSPSSGCVPANVTLSSNVAVPVGGSVTQYAWDFGDGNSVSTTSGSTSHIYPLAGNYNPKLSITTNEGCTNTFSFPPVAFGTPPYNVVAYPIDSVVCGSEVVGVVAKATNANSYFWDFGDGTTRSVVDTSTAHKYSTLGVKRITVVPGYNRCYTSPTSFQVRVIGVIATYTYANTCADRKTYSFTNTSQGNQSLVTWDFGDGSSVVHTPNAVHTFPDKGSFVTRLTVMDSITGCIDTYERTIYTSDPVMQNPDTSICRNTNTTFTLANDYGNPIATYNWHVVGRIATTSQPDVNIKATIFGNHSNLVVINLGPQSCPDTIRLDHRIQVKGPDLSYNSPASVCLQDSFQVVNSSKPYLPGDSVLLWHWNYGVDSTNDSTYQPAPYVYETPSSYKVKLTATDINGCTDSLVKPVVINPLPFLFVIPSIDTLCAGDQAELIAFHSGRIEWIPTASLSCATCDTVVANPTSNTKYFVSAITQFGCTVTDSVDVKVFSPFTAAISGDATICQNDSAHLMVTPADKIIEWTPTTGLINPNRPDQTVFPQQTTVYRATLKDSVGCFTSTADFEVKVKSLPVVNAGPDQVLPYYSNFTISPQYSSNVANYSWTPSEQLSCITCPFPTGQALKSINYVIQVTSDSGCVAKDAINIVIECKDANLLIPSAFTPNRDNLNDVLYPITRGIKSIIRFSIYDRYGKIVFERKNFPPNDKTYGWDGRIKGNDQSANTYVYYLEAECALGEKLFKKGAIILLK